MLVDHFVILEGNVHDQDQLVETFLVQEGEEACHFEVSDRVVDPDEPLLGVTPVDSPLAPLRPCHQSVIVLVQIAKVSGDTDLCHQ